MINLPRRTITNVYLALFCIAVSGCMATAKPQNDFIEIPTDHSDQLNVSGFELHDSDLMGDPLNVIFGFDVIGLDELNLQPELVEGIYTILSDNWVKTNKHGDQGTAPLKDEIERSLRKTANGAYYGEQKVNYLLMARLETSRFKNQYEAPSFLCTSWKDDCQGSCEFETVARLELEALSLPSQRRAKKWVLKTSSKDSFSANKNCPSSTTPGDAVNTYKHLVNKVNKTLLNCSKPLLQEYFSSRGYIISYHSDGNSFQFQTSAGSAAGFSKGDKVIIERLHDSGATRIATGKIIAVEQKRSIVAVKNQDIANSIQIHDRVRVERKSYIPNLSCQFVVDEK